MCNEYSLLMNTGQSCTLSQTIMEFHTYIQRVLLLHHHVLSLVMMTHTHTHTHTHVMHTHILQYTGPQESLNDHLLLSIVCAQTSGEMNLK